MNSNETVTAIVVLDSMFPNLRWRKGFENLPARILFTAPSPFNHSHAAAVGGGLEGFHFSTLEDALAEFFRGQNCRKPGRSFFGTCWCLRHCFPLAAGQRVTAGFCRDPGPRSLLPLYCLPPVPDRALCSG